MMYWYGRFSMVVYICMRAINVTVCIYNGVKCIKHTKAAAEEYISVEERTINVTVCINNGVKCLKRKKAAVHYIKN